MKHKYCRSQGETHISNVTIPHKYSDAFYIHSFLEGLLCIELPTYVDCVLLLHLMFKVIWPQLFPSWGWKYPGDESFVVLYQPHVLQNVPMWTQALFLFLLILLSVLCWWHPGACCPNFYSLKKGSVWGNWCVPSHLRQLLWKNTVNGLTLGLLLAWHMTSEKFQCCHIFASGKPQLLCPDHLRLVEEHNAWEV